MTEVKVPFFKFNDLFWFLAIGLLLAGSGIWQALSPRPEIGKVAVLWLPSAVLLVALVRNWGRKVFIGLSILTFYVVGLIPSFENASHLSSFLLLSADIFEVGLIACILTRWGGNQFRMVSALTVSIFGVAALGACFLSSFMAAAVSQLQLGAMPIVESAPLQVGVAWFTSNLATYLLVAAPLLALTGRDGATALKDLKSTPIPTIMGAGLVMVLTFIGFVGPQILVEKTRLALGSGGLILVAFPLASFLAIRRGPTVAALVGAAIGIPTLYATIAGLGPFGKGNLEANIFDMQATLIVTMFTLLLIGAMAEQLRDRARALERALDDAMTRRQDFN
jgi:hypothetical protein